MNSRNIMQPIGFRFRPTDEELLSYFLFGKINGDPSIQNGKIKDIDIYNHEPTELYDADLDDGDGRMYFFSPIRMMRQTGKRAKRDTKHGFWRASQRCCNILDNTRNIIGTKMPLVYFSKSKNATTPPQKTAWLMSEYRLYNDNIYFPQCGKRVALCVVYNNERNKKRSDCSSFGSHQDEGLEMARDVPEIAADQPPLIPNPSPVSSWFCPNISNNYLSPSSSSQQPISNYNPTTFDISFLDPISNPNYI